MLVLNIFSGFLEFLQKHLFGQNMWVSLPIGEAIT